MPVPQFFSRPFQCLRLRLLALSVCAFATATLTACTAVTDDARATLEYAFQRGEDVRLTDEEVAAFRFTALYAKWDDAPQILLVLGYADGSELSWVSGDLETMVTQHGRVIRTAGVDFELVGVSNLASDPLRCIVTQPEQCPTQWQRELDVSTPRRTYSRSVVSDFSIEGQTTLQLASGEYEVTHVLERGHVGQQRFTNEFWLEADGHVVKSQQHIVPERSRITLEQMKWVGR